MLYTIPKLIQTRRGTQIHADAEFHTGIHASI